MNFTPKTESELNESILLADGKYKASVYDAKDTDELGRPLLTQKGDEKINLICEVYAEGNKTTKINAVLTPGYMKLLKHFCDVCGFSNKYEEGSLTAQDCRQVQKFFIVEVSKGSYISKKTGNEIIINQINDFLPFDQKSESEKFIDDNLADIPF